jgi:Domain of unknown function (DUF4440)
VKAAAQQRAAALARQDWATIERVLHPEFVYVNAEGIRLTRDDYLAFVRDGPLRWTSQTLEDVQVVSAGSVAVLTATVRDDVMVGDERHELVFMSTQTYVQEGGAWLYLAGQTGPKR